MTIRTLVILLSLALVSSTALAQRGTDIRYAAGDTVNVRSEPEGAVVDSLQRGEAVIVAASPGSWSQVDTAHRSGVWVSTSLLCRDVGCWASSSGRSAASRSLPPAVRTAPSSSYRPTTSGGCLLWTEQLHRPARRPLPHHIRRQQALSSLRVNP